MDAISFVLGVKSAQLRSSQLKDLVYRGRKLVDDAAEEPSNASLDMADDRDGEGTASRAWVLAIFKDAEGNEWRFKRT
jgi:structural maintenance of chromosome 1